MGGLRGFFARSPLGVVFRFPLFCSRFVFSARSFALRSPSFPMVSVFSSIPLKALFFFVFVPLFSSFRSRLRLFPFSLIRLALPFVSFVVFGFLSASLHRDAPSGGGVGPTGQGCPRARGWRPRGWRGDAGPGSRTRAAMGAWGRRRRGGRRPAGSAGRRTRRRR